MKKSKNIFKSIVVLLFLFALSIASLIIIANSTSFAHAESITTLVGLDPQNGEDISIITGTYGEKLQIGLDAPEYYGHNFLGYYEEEQVIGKGKNYYNEKMVPVDVWDKTEDTRIYAHWEPVEKTIVLNMQGGYNGTTFVTGKFNSKLPSGKIKPERYGYNFLGYFEKPQSQGSGKQYYYSDMGAVEIWNNIDVMEIYAHWEGVKSKVTLDKSGGENGTNAVDAVFGQPMLSNKTKPTRVGYKFLGYFEKEQSAGLINNTQYYDENMVSAHNWDKVDNQTLYAHWEPIVYTITYRYNGAGAVSNPTTYTIETPTFNLNSPTGSPKTGYKYGWSISKIAQGTSGNLIINAVAKPIQYYVYFENMNPSIMFPFYPGDYCDYDVEYTYSREWIVPQDGWEFDAWKLTNEQTGVQTRVGTGMTYTFKNLSAVEGDRFKIGAYYKEKSCVTNGSLITLADGSQKAVENLTGDEMLLVWNLYTGTFDIAPILFIDSDPAKFNEVIKLYFSDGTEVKIISEHAFWDFDLNKYVFLRNDAAKYIGHWFNKQITDENGQIAWTKVQLNNVVVAEEYTTAWSPVTYGHLCYYVNGMLSMPGSTDGLINIFDVDEETLKINEEKMQNDIDLYGLYSYEEFTEIYAIPKDIFDAFQGQYLKISICKGLISLEQIGKLIEQYAEFIN